MLSPIDDTTPHSRGDVWLHKDGSIGHSTRVECDQEPASTLIKLIIPIQDGFRLLTWRYPWELADEGWIRISIKQPMRHIYKALG